MERYKWYQLGLPSTFEEFTSAIRRARYKEGGSSGFLRKEAEGDRIAFRFYWSSNISKLVLAPDGETRVEQVPSWEYCDFGLIRKEDRVWMRVTNPHRSLRDLLNALERLEGLGFSADPVPFLEKNRMPAFPKGTEKKLLSFRAVCSLPEENAVARVEAAARNGLDLKEFSLLRGTPHTLEQVTYEITFRRTKGQVTVTSTGGLRVSGQLAPFLVETFEAAVMAR